MRISWSTRSTRSWRRYELRGTAAAGESAVFLEQMRALALVGARAVGSAGDGHRAHQGARKCRVPARLGGRRPGGAAGAPAVAITRTRSSIRNSHWLRALEAAGIAVPRVIRSRHGRDFEVVARALAVRGRSTSSNGSTDNQLGSVESGLTGTDESAVAGQYHRIGVDRRAHAQPELRAGSTRLVSDAMRGTCAGLVGEQPLWGRFWELAALTHSQKSAAGSRPRPDRERPRGLWHAQRTATGSSTPISSRRICSWTAIGFASSISTTPDSAGICSSSRPRSTSSAAISDLSDGARCADSRLPQRTPTHR